MAMTRRQEMCVEFFGRELLMSAKSCGMNIGFVAELFEMAHDRIVSDNEDADRTPGMPRMSRQDHLRLLANIIRHEHHEAIQVFGVEDADTLAVARFARHMDDVTSELATMGRSCGAET
jgi:hypothetical protein